MYGSTSSHDMVRFIKGKWIYYGYTMDVYKFHDMIGWQWVGGFIMDIYKDHRYGRNSRNPNR